MFILKPQIFGTRCPCHAEAGASALEGVKYAWRWRIELKSLSTTARRKEREMEDGPKV